MIPLCQGDRGACFLVSRQIREIIIRREPFVMRARADSTGDIHVLLSRIPPHPVNHPEQCLVARFRCDVRRAAQQISSADRMPFNVAMIANRNVILPVTAVISVQRLRAAVDEGRFGKLVLGTVRVRWMRDQRYYDQDEWRGTWAMRLPTKSGSRRAR